MSELLELDERARTSRRSLVLLAIAALSYAALLAWALPRSADPLPPFAAFPLAHALALSVVTALTAFVLWLECLRSRRRGYLVLGGTFSTITVFMIGFILSFPSGLRTDAEGRSVPLLGGASTSVSFFIVWHVALALGVAASAIVHTRDVESGRRPVMPRMWPGIALGVLPAAVLSAVMLLQPSWFPVLFAAGTATPVGRTALLIGLLLTVAGLVVTVVVTRGRSLLSRWLIAVSVLNVGDAWLNLHAERYSLGWYLARGFGFVALSSLLVILVWEVSRIDQRMQTLALHDTLTGARARVTFTTDAEREMARSNRDGTQLALIWLDLDVFKQVNDRFGHAAGDAVLVEVGRRVRKELRGADLVVRMGGDEFGILLVGLSDDAVAESVATRIVAALREPIRLADGQVLPYGSLGIAVYPDTAGDIEELVHQADVAMYTAKSTGGDRWLRYDPTQDVGYTSRATLRRRLDRALLADELDLDAQPIVSSADGALQGVELLLRWQHDGTRVSGAQFAMEAERVGRSADIAHVVLDRLAVALPSLVEGCGIRMVSINLCVDDVLDAAIVGRLLDPPLRDHSAVVVLELIESAAIDDSAVAAFDNLALLRSHGYRLALDDFGVGFSNIVRLQQLRPDVIKLDRSLLLRAAGEEPGAFDVLAWATSIGRTLGAVTLVEGVETDAEALLVRAAGAELAQGYWFGRPAPLHHLVGYGAARR